MSTIQSSFEILPPELIIHIFGDLTPKELATCSLVNRMWHLCSKDNCLWEALCRKEHLPSITSEKMVDDMRSHYITFTPYAIRQKAYKKEVHEYPALTYLFKNNVPMRDVPPFESRSQVPMSHPVWHNKTFGLLGRNGVSLWDLKAEQFAQTVNEKCDAFDFDEHVLITAHGGKSGRSEIKEWDRKTKECSSTYYLEESINFMSLHANELCMATGKGLSWLDKAQPECVVSFGPKHPFSYVSHHDSFFLASDIMTNTVHRFDSRTYENISTFKIDHPYRLLFHEETLISNTWNGYQMFDLRTGQQMHDHNCPYHVCIDLQGKILATTWRSSNPSLWSEMWNGSLIGTIALTDIEAQTELKSFSTDFQLCNTIRWIDSSIVGLTKEGHIVTWS